MQVDHTADQHDDSDTDSLFGSPPPSPSRGRSPSPLALPGGQNDAQNVGTLALPGSHLCSELYELPSAPSPTPSVPAKRSMTQHSYPQIPPPRSNSGTPAPANLGPRSATSSRKPKRTTRRSTPDVRPTPPPITLPSPSDPPPANFLRNQQALLGLAGLVGGVNPANLSVQRHTRGESPSNPIVVEDVPDAPKIGRRPAHEPAFMPGPMPMPSAQEVVSTLVRQKNLYPLVNALVRLVNNAAGVPVVPVPYPPSVPPTASAAGPSQPPSYLPAYYSYSPYQYSYPYTYPYSYPYPASYPHASYHQYAVPFQPPPVKKRRLTNVPAGAADWDVPYPFPAGQGPRNYHSTWARHRQQQLLDDLVGLVKSASQKAAAKKAKDEAGSEAAIGSVEYYKERFLRHCRPPSQEPAQQSEGEPQESARVGPAPPEAPKIGTLRPAFPQTTLDPAVQAKGFTGAHAGAVQSTLEQASDSQRTQSSVNESAGDDIVAGNHVPKTPPLTNTDLPTSTFPPISPEMPNTETPGNSDLDELLALLNDIPASDLDAIFASPDSQSENQPSTSTSPFPDITHASTSSESPALDPSLFAMDPSLLAIDPSLLAISFPPPMTQSNPASAEPEPEPEAVGTSSNASNSPAVPFTSNAASPTPPLAGSPMSFADQDPQTPNWDFNFPEPEIAAADGESGNGGEAIQTGASSAAAKDLRRRVLTKRLGAVHSVDGDEFARRKDKGKQRATEEDFVEVRRDRSASTPGLVSESSTPGPATGREPAPAVSSKGNATPRLATSTSNTPPYLYPLPLSLPSYALPFSAPVLPTTPFLARSTVINKSSSSSLQGKNKEDIIRRARLMRAQILEEIERAKVELWETTMEGGCLAVLAKEREKLAQLGVES